MRTRSGARLLIALSFLTFACNQNDFKGSSAKLNPLVSKDFKQAAYPDAETTLHQGFSGTPADESFDQGTWGKLDLLVVVDNSGSMAEEQVNLATKLQPLLSEIDRADWQIAVVTSDPADGCQRALIKKSDPDAAQRFEAAVRAGTNGTGEERVILQAVRGLEGKCLAQPWVRPDSTVSVLLISDEDNCHLDDTQGYGCVGQPDRYQTYLADYLKTIRTPGKDARVYGIFWGPAQPQSDCPTALDAGIEYDKIVSATGGKWGSICDADYTTTLTAISTDIAQILKYEFELKNTPDAGTLVVTVDGAPWDKFTLDGKVVKFSEPPPFGAKVAVTYKSGADGVLSSDFALDKVPADGSLVVSIDGKALDPSTYHWDPQAKKIVFNAPPAEQSEIKVSYKAVADLGETFTIGSTALPETVQAYVDGKLVQGVSYDKPSGVVTIRPAPPSEAAVKVTFREH